MTQENDYITQQIISPMGEKGLRYIHPITKEIIKDEYINRDASRRIDFYENNKKNRVHLDIMGVIYQGYYIYKDDNTLACLLTEQTDKSQKKQLFETYNEKELLIQRASCVAFLQQDGSLKPSPATQVVYEDFNYDQFNQIESSSYYSFNNKNNAQFLYEKGRVVAKKGIIDGEYVDEEIDYSDDFINNFRSQHTFFKGDHRISYDYYKDQPWSFYGRDNAGELFCGKLEKSPNSPIRSQTVESDIITTKETFLDDGKTPSDVVCEVNTRFKPLNKPLHLYLCDFDLIIPPTTKGVDFKFERSYQYDRETKQVLSFEDKFYSNGYTFLYRNVSCENGLPKTISGYDHQGLFQSVIVLDDKARPIEEISRYKRRKTKRSYDRVMLSDNGSGKVKLTDLDKEAIFPQQASNQGCFTSLSRLFLIGSLAMSFLDPSVLSIRVGDKDIKDLSKDMYQKAMQQPIIKKLKEKAMK